MIDTPFLSTYSYLKTFSEMMREFKLDISLCSGSMTIPTIGINITATHEDYCQVDDIKFEPKQSKSKVSELFTCHRPLIAFTNVKLQNRQSSKICITKVGLETTKKKFLKEGLDIHIAPAFQWSEKIHLPVFGMF